MILSLFGALQRSQRQMENRKSEFSYNHFVVILCSVLYNLEPPTHTEVLNGLTDKFEFLIT